MQTYYKKASCFSLFLILIFCFTANTVLAVDTCPGEPQTLYWLSSNTSGVCTPDSITPGGGSIPSCNFTVIPNSSNSSTIYPAASCTVTLTCDGLSASDSLTVNPNQSRCCGNWGLASSTYWNGSTCSEGSDLTATEITPTSAIVGDTTILSSTVTNSGPFSTNLSFSNLFQVTFSPNGAGGVIDVSPLPTAGPLVSGASATVTRTTTFNGGPRTYSYRLCADKTSSAGGGVINESDENNNCGAWQNISVTCPPGENWVAGNCTASPLSNLTTNAVTPTTATAGVSTLFSARVRNIGGGNIQTPFSNLFQISDQPGGAGSVTDLYPLVGFGSLLSGASVFANFNYSFPDGPGTYSIRSCADQTSNIGGGVVWEDDEADNCGAWTDVVVTCPVGTYWSTDSCIVGAADVDLEADASTPVTAEPNISNMLSAVITNSGSLSTGGSFDYFFQVADQAGGAGTVIDLPSSSMGTLAGGASNTGTRSYTFPNGPGTYSVRVCADKSDRNDGGSITETDENNNCGSPWTTVTVACTGSDQWDTLGQTCTDPQVISATILNQHYPPGSINLECNADTTSYSITTNFPAPGTVVVAPDTPYTYPSTIALNTPAPYGTSYSMTCEHGSVSGSRSVAYDPTPRPTTMTVVPAVTVVPDPPEQVPISWVVAYPDNTCTLTAKVVCANNACSAAQLASQASLNNELQNTSTDLNDPNTTRPMLTALRNPAPGHKDSDTPVIIADYKALGKKTLLITNTTDLTLDCNGSKITKRIRVTKNEEQ